LVWTTPPDAVTTTLRYSGGFITEADWATAPLITDTLPGGAETFTALVPYTGGTLYYAHKSQNTEGEFSDVSNNAVWPSRDTYLPLVMRGG
jgi:hypothetical protein